ncbi:OVARIAN TUMOR DOMAIN-containing deubiquitinating enzyme 4-like isoform X1 [Miscanthus floridulus]|uniref:OVARIAN TUMOR DOMAIN-containing deubiquitinating enzyme 4-like isoform X1 n=1 Tax=Miscanthus floridulus TaxID=154761 RepID=UPI003457E50D
MLINMPNICWRSFTSCNMYSPSNQLQGSFTRRVDLWSTSCSQAVGHHARVGSVDFSVKKNVKSSQLQNATCFVGLGQQLQCRLSARSHILNVKSDILSHQKVSVSWSLGSMPQRIGCVVSGLGFAVSGLASAEGPVNNNIDSTEPDKSSTNLSHGKNVYTDYSVTGIPGDGRCLFRSVAHGACIRSRKPIPNEDHQRKLADELRTKVADEFIKRRAETEWFVEGDFDTYVSQIRKPHVWGGEPELFMASHVLQMPITVYMHDNEAGGLIAIAEYGQEYGTEAPIQVLYHGYGHYDALQITGKGGPRSRL